MKQYSISQLAKKCGLSRSTLLHYDSIGLLKPTMRTDANYRVYTEKDYERLHRVCSLRSTGLSLENISKIIDSDNSAVADILQKRIDKINNEMQKLRFQQNVIVKLLGDDGLLKSTRIITKAMWVGLLESAGLDENGMRKWHKEFEQSMPEGHQDFLESLGLHAEEISDIRDWAKKTHKLPCNLAIRSNTTGERVSLIGFGHLNTTRSYTTQARRASLLCVSFSRSEFARITNLQYDMPISRKKGICTFD